MKNPFNLKIEPTTVSKYRIKPSLLLLISNKLKESGKLELFQNKSGKDSLKTR